MTLTATQCNRPPDAIATVRATVLPADLEYCVSQVRFNADAFGLIAVIQRLPKGPVGRLFRGGARMLLPLLFAVAAGHIAPAPVFDDAAYTVTGLTLDGSAVALDAPALAEADPGLPAFGHGGTPFELAPRDGRVRPPAGAPRTDSVSHSRAHAAGSRALALLSDHRRYAHALRAQRRNLPVTFSNPPPTSVS